MFDGLLKPKFYHKCKTTLKLMKTRIETIKRKRNSVEKFLKKDIADLLQNDLDTTAYSRTEGLLVEQNMTSCYVQIEDFIGCVSSHLSLMQKQRECPEECKEAVSSLVYAAARFADLPELRELRSLFTERYGNALDPYVNKEFVEKLRPHSPTREAKLQLMCDIAQEFSVNWDSKTLEQKLSTQEQSKYESYNDTDDGEPKCHNGQDYMASKRNEKNLPLYDRKNVGSDIERINSSSEDEIFSPSITKSTSKDGHTNSSSSDCVSEEEVSSKRSLHYRDIPPPYTKQGKSDKQGQEAGQPYKSKYNINAIGQNRETDLVPEARPKPTSVRRRRSKPPPDHGAAESSPPVHPGNVDERDNEEIHLDGLLMHYSKKKSPYELDKVKESLEPPPSGKTNQNSRESMRLKPTKSDMCDPPARAASFPVESTTSNEASDKSKGHLRSTSLQSDLLAGHVHPKLPDCDDLAARIAALRGR